MAKWELNINKIKGLYGSAGMNQGDYAEVMKWATSTAYNKLTGKTDFTASEITETCNLFNVEPAFLFTKPMCEINNSNVQ